MINEGARNTIHKGEGSPREINISPMHDVMTPRQADYQQQHHQNDQGNNQNHDVSYGPGQYLGLPPHQMRGAIMSAGGLSNNHFGAMFSAGKYSISMIGGEENAHQDHHLNPYDP